MVQLGQVTAPKQNGGPGPSDDVRDIEGKEVLSDHADNGRISSFSHESTPALRRMPVSDVVVNNPDCNGDQFLAMGPGSACRGAFKRVDPVLKALRSELAGLLTAKEIASSVTLCARMRSREALHEGTAQTLTLIREP